jgi:hypothetical protein
MLRRVKALTLFLNIGCCAPRVQMGFNTWNLYHCSVDADILTSTATAMVQTGLKDAGYIYVNSVRRSHRPPLPPSLSRVCLLGVACGRTTAG